MTRPITFGARLGGQWYVCVFGRYGVGSTLAEALRAAGMAS